MGTCKGFMKMLCSFAQTEQFKSKRESNVLYSLVMHVLISAWYW